MIVTMIDDYFLLMSVKRKFDPDDFLSRVLSNTLIVVAET